MKNTRHVTLSELFYWDFNSTNKHGWADGDQIPAN